ncbi:M15 family metallopeptidase [Virgibacillus kekensis]|uniref:M15 family metallopeptidase n=1 Tax=Virgibacillus kekensis TaxID=202261 RepID=A0ABV9DNH2_9BACI
MRRYATDFTAWGILILLVIVLLLVFSQRESRYKDLGDDAPLPDKLNPVVEEKMDKLVQRAADKGIEIVITETVRSKIEQNELYAKGRTADGSVVTYARGGESYHNYGLAFDYALRNKDGELIWDINYDGNGNGKPDWFEVAEIAKDLGFEWGGDWSRFKDYPHLQMDFGLSIRQLQNGLRPKHEKKDDPK